MESFLLQYTRIPFSSFLFNHRREFFFSINFSFHRLSSWHFFFLFSFDIINAFLFLVCHKYSYQQLMLFAICTNIYIKRRHEKVSNYGFPSAIEFGFQWKCFQKNSKWKMIEQLMTRHSQTFPDMFGVKLHSRHVCLFCQIPSHKQSQHNFY